MSRGIFFFTFFFLLTGPTLAEFDSGSDGSFGPLVVTAADPNNVTVPLPADGVIRATTVSIAVNKTVTFGRNALNTPVVILAQGDVEILGTINVSGSNGTSTTGGLGGPGGYSGGSPGSAEAPAGAGNGLGGGSPGDRLANSPTGAGGGSYSSQPTTNPDSQHGIIYGSPLLVPPVGGSGGGGIEFGDGAVSGGGGGGGAILIASNTRIRMAFPGGITSFGGVGLAGFSNGGSGGGVRLVAPIVEGNGFIHAFGDGFGQRGGNGRIRVDTLDRSGMNLQFNPPVEGVSVGSFMVAIPEGLPRLDIVQAAGQDIPEGGNPVSIALPFGSDPNQSVVVRAANFEGLVNIDVVVTPDHGPRSVYPAMIDAASANPAEVTVPVLIPQNTGVKINVWTR